MLEPSDSVPIALKVIVVGGGLCGLATAIAVSLAGHKVTVFEASNRVHPFGSGLQSSPNGTRLFSKWGLDEILKPAVTAPKSLQIHSCDGALLARRDNFDVDTAGQYSSPLWTVHRVDLQASLLRRAIKLGVKIQFSSPVTDVDNDSLEIQLASGAKHRGDLVVIASGTWSDALRSKVLGRTVDADPTNETAYRINIDPKGVRDEELLELIGSSQIRIWIGPGSYAIGYPVRGSTQFCILFVLSDDFHKIHSIPVSAIDELRMRLQNWDPILNAMLNAAMPNGTIRVNKWRLCRVSPPPSWVSPQTSCVLAGDCCHTVQPFLAQGLNMGLEDAATLGHLLSKVTSPTQLPKATALYNSLRTARTMKLVEETNIYRSELMDQRLESAQESGMDWKEYAEF